MPQSGLDQNSTIPTKGKRIVMGLISEFSIQLYSLREEMKDDFAGVMRRVGEIGYTGVEFAGYGGLTADEMKALLSECGLKSVGSHVPLERLQNNLEEELAFNKAIGTKYIIVPYFVMKNEEDVNTLAAQMREIAPKVRAAGFEFGYHNHAHEFEKDGGSYLLDLLLEKVPAEEMFLELDVFWASVASVDYISYIEKHAGRIPMLHLKQTSELGTQKCVDLDEGVIDFRELVLTGQKSGVKEYILEQEEFAVSAYQSIEKGFKHITSL